MSLMMLSLLVNAFFQTLAMVVVASFVATVLGLPLGVLLYATRFGHILAHRSLHRLLAICVNVLRSVPFIILMVAIIPFTRLVVGSSIGTLAAIVPLSLCAIPFIGRVVESALLKVDKGLIEAALAMGATPSQIIRKILLPEALAGIIHGLTLAVISLVGYSAMAGVVGGGGLGDIAIRYGYQRFEPGVMVITLCSIVVLVQLIQWLGDSLARKYMHFRD